MSYLFILLPCLCPIVISKSFHFTQYIFHTETLNRIQDNMQNNILSSFISFPVHPSTVGWSQDDTVYICLLRAGDSNHISTLPCLTSLATSSKGYLSSYADVYSILVYILAGIKTEVWGHIRCNIVYEFNCWLPQTLVWAQFNKQYSFIKYVTWYLAGNTLKTLCQGLICVCLFVV